MTPHGISNNGAILAVNRAGCQAWNSQLAADRRSRTSICSIASETSVLESG
jgi:hypothetical protein